MSVLLRSSVCSRCGRVDLYYGISICLHCVEVYLPVGSVCSHCVEVYILMEESFCGHVQECVFLMSEVYITMGRICLLCGFIWYILCGDFFANVMCGFLWIIICVHFSGYHMGGFTCDGVADGSGDVTSRFCDVSYRLPL